MDSRRGMWEQRPSNCFTEGGNGRIDEDHLGGSSRPRRRVWDASHKLSNWILVQAIGGTQEPLAELVLLVN